MRLLGFNGVGFRKLMLYPASSYTCIFSLQMIRRVFDPEKKNPNECPIVSTFYVSNENTNYCSVNRLWAEGHEMGVNGVTRHSQLWWQEADSVLWNEEVKAQLENLDEDGGISK